MVGVAVGGLVLVAVRVGVLVRVCVAVGVRVIVAVCVKVGVGHPSGPHGVGVGALQSTVSVSKTFPIGVGVVNNGGEVGVLVDPGGPAAGVRVPVGVCVGVAVG
jgi:hypothetical protein